MKSLFLFVAFLIASSFGVQAQAPTMGGAKIEFTKEVYDYGAVKYGGNGTSKFEFKNTGNAPLIISKTEASCNCTVPDYPKEPIAPGATGVITVKYDTKKVGPINKSISIFSNASNEPTKVIRIKGTVLQEGE